MLGETFFDIGLFEKPSHETLPHRIPSRCLAILFVEIAFAFACAKKPGREMNGSSSLGLRDGLFERRRPLKYARSSSGPDGLVGTHDNSLVREISHSQPEHVPTTYADEKLESYVCLDHQHGPGFSLRLQRKRLGDLPVLDVPISSRNATQTHFRLEWVSIENTPLHSLGKSVSEYTNLIKCCGSDLVAFLVDPCVHVLVDMTRKDARTGYQSNLRILPITEPPSARRFYLAWRRANGRRP